MSFLPQNNNNKVACALVLDGSSSMNINIAENFTRLDAMNAGIEVFEKELLDDKVASKAVDVAVVKVTNPKPQVILDWTLAENFKAPRLKAQGSTPLAEALIKAIEMCENKKKDYLTQGMDYYRPWIIVISDGQPTSDHKDWQEAVDLAQEVIKSKKALIIGVAIDGCPTDKLSEISSNKVMELSSHSFKEFFLWLSASLSMTSSSADVGSQEQYAAFDILNSY